jgi:hypothetical protein
MTSTLLPLDWRPFENIPSGPEAASAASSCGYSLGTLEVAFLHQASSFALTERKHPEVWRWAIIDKDGSILEEGCEPTQGDAKRSAAEALNLASDETVDDAVDSVAGLGRATACDSTLPA